MAPKKTTYKKQVSFGTDVKASESESVKSPLKMNTELGGKIKKLSPVTGAAESTDAKEAFERLLKEASVSMFVDDDEDEIPGVSVTGTPLTPMVVPDKASKGAALAEIDNSSDDNSDDDVLPSWSGANNNTQSPVTPTTRLEFTAQDNSPRDVETTTTAKSKSIAASPPLTPAAARSNQVEGEEETESSDPIPAPVPASEPEEQPKKPDTSGNNNNVLKVPSVVVKASAKKIDDKVSAAAASAAAKKVPNEEKSKADKKNKKNNKTKEKEMEKEKGFSAIKASTERVEESPSSTDILKAHLSSIELSASSSASSAAEIDPFSLAAMERHLAGSPSSSEDEEAEKDAPVDESGLYEQDLVEGNKQSLADLMSQIETLKAQVEGVVSDATDTAVSNSPSRKTSGGSGDLLGPPLVIDDSGDEGSEDTVPLGITTTTTTTSTRAGDGSLGPAMLSPPGSPVPDASGPSLMRQVSKLSSGMKASAYYQHSDEEGEGEAEISKLEVEAPSLGDVPPADEQEYGMGKQHRARHHHHHRRDHYLSDEETHHYEEPTETWEEHIEGHAQFAPHLRHDTKLFHTTDIDMEVHAHAHRHASHVEADHSSHGHHQHHHNHHHHHHNDGGQERHQHHSHHSEQQQQSQQEGEYAKSREYGTSGKIATTPTTVYQQLNVPAPTIAVPTVVLAPAPAPASAPAPVVAEAATPVSREAEYSNAMVNDLAGISKASEVLQGYRAHLAALDEEFSKYLVHGHGIGESTSDDENDDESGDNYGNGSVRSSMDREGREQAARDKAARAALELQTFSFDVLEAMVWQKHEELLMNKMLPAEAQ
jgi:hypothetical protein